MDAIIYVLECSQDKYYVGKTNRLDDRLLEHITNRGSAWTKKYTPISIIETVSNVDEFDEDKYVKIYMKKYGIDNVRGGSYSQIDLPDYSILALEKELRGATDTCFHCGGDHYVNKCTSEIKPNVKTGAVSSEKPRRDRNNVKSSKYVWLCDGCDVEFMTKADAESHEKICIGSNNDSSNYGGDSGEDDSDSDNDVYCYRCRRKGHYANKCYARTNRYGKSLS